MNDERQKPLNDGPQEDIDLIRAPKMHATAAANLLGVKVATVYRWIEEGKLPAYRLGRKKMVLESDLLAFLERVPVKGQKPPPPRPARTAAWAKAYLDRARI